ncbi:MAG TPA: hypothetical protein VMW41_00585 [Candidatus Bathyarchaeia archaeon]|nr:hypothetical protein [Candidatus Bathyarchaeia archaeon]
MKDIEAKLNQAATLLAEVMLSQLGFNFIPKVRIELSYIFQIKIILTGSPYEIPFNYYEKLSFTRKEGFNEPIYTAYAI